MAIRMVEDVGAPLVVSGVNILTRTTIPAYHDWVIYLLTALGYAGSFIGLRGDFVKNIGVSSLPLTVDKIYERVRGGGVGRRVSFRSAQGVSRYPASASESPFQGVKLT